MAATPPPDRPALAIDHTGQPVPEEAFPATIDATRAGRGHELLLFTGQSAALVHHILPAAELSGRLVDETEAAMRTAAKFIAR